MRTVRCIVSVGAVSFLVGSCGGDNGIVKGTKKTVTIDQIVAAEGARTPSSKDAQKAFSMAFAVYSEKPLSSAEMSWVDVYADFFGRKDVSGTMPFYKATGGRATMNTTLPKLAGE
jgi:hypothetical protein